MKYIILFASFAPLALFAQGSYTLISKTNVIDVSKGTVQRNASVLIKDGNVEEVFINKKFVVPANAVVIDGTAKYLMPGMTDGHIHFFQSGGLYTRPDAFDFTHIVAYNKEREFNFNNAEDFLTRYLRMGITTVADVGGPMSNFRVRDSISRRGILPNVLVTGPLFSMVDDDPLDNGDAPIIKTTSIEDADALFDKVLPLKPDYIKIWYIVTPELPADKTFPVVQHIARRTHDAKLKLAVHATQLRTAELAVDAGADILVHSVDNEVVSEQFIKKLVAKKVSYIPTLIVYDGYSRTMFGDLLNDPLDLRFANPFVFSSLSDPKHLREADLPEYIKQAPSMKQEYVKKGMRSDSVMAVNLKKLVDAGVNVVAGTDAGNVGTMHATSFFRELLAMKRAGLTNAAVLKTATSNSAYCFNQNTGAVVKGRKADLLLLTRNPFDDLANLNSVEVVFKSGQMLKVDDIVRETPEMLIQRQVNAYNARDLDAFLATYAEDIKLFDFPDSLIAEGKEKMKAIYGPFFKDSPDLHCEIVNRIKLGNTIIDHERVRFGDKVISAAAIYEIKDGKIAKVTFKK